MFFLSFFVIGSILKSSPAKRLSLQEIRNSAWLSDIIITENYFDKWCLLPTIDQRVNLSEIEQKAREELKAYGIDSSALEEHALKGIQSEIIATYRIIVHRLLISIHLPAVTRITGKKLNHASSNLCIIM